MRPRIPPFLTLAPAMLLAAAAVGCGQPQMKLTVRPDDQLNDRRPCYVLVRNVDSKTYLEESYQAAAAKVMSPDDSVLQTAVVFPGTKQDIEVSPPSKGKVALYVFFYKPQGDWKVLFAPAADSYDVTLEGSRLKVQKR